MKKLEEFVHELGRTISECQRLFRDPITDGKAFLQRTALHIRIAESLFFPVRKQCGSSLGRQAERIDIDTEIEDFVLLLFGESKDIAPMAG